MIMRNHATLLAATSLFLVWQIGEAFYVPGGSSTSFAEDDLVELYIDKITSTVLPFPIDYYSLPFCRPAEFAMPSVGIGQFLAGERISRSPYKIHMKLDIYCEQLCISNPGRGDNKYLETAPSKTAQTIRTEYHHNWIIDNLPAAYKMHDQLSNNTKYFGGFPIGFVDPNNGLSYIYNHVNIELQYHTVDVESDDQKFRIVGFTIEPFSINHDFEINTDAYHDDDTYTIAEIKDPILSCNPHMNNTHTESSMVSQGSAQLSSGPVLFTYDVIWSNNEDLQWASRWNVYLNMNNVHPISDRWLSISNALVLVFILSTTITAILVRILHHDFACYSSVPTEEETIENLIGWKVLYADVFRPPNYPMLFSVCCGSGVQILCTSIFTIALTQIGFLSPPKRRYYFICVLLIYALMGFISGYTTARLFKSFKGRGWKKSTILTAVSFPGIAFTVFFVFNILAMVNDSFYVPFFVMFQLLVLWFGITTPIVFWGAFTGFKRHRIEFPSNVKSIPREIPCEPWYMGLIPTMVFGCFIPLIIWFHELSRIMSSLWLHQYYYTFELFFFAFLMLVLTCAEIAVVFTYYHLYLENYRWWWQSFIITGSTGLYVLGFSLLFYLTEFRGNSISAFGFYFGFMTLVSLAISLMMGSAGFLSSLWFNCTIFSFLEQEMCHHHDNDSSTVRAIC